MTEPKPKGRPPERLIVIINFKMALGTPAEVETVTWPKGWPLPVAGDLIRVRQYVGFVTHLTFDLTNGHIEVNTR